MNKIFEIISTDGGTWLVNIKKIINILYDELADEYTILLDNNYKLTVCFHDNIEFFNSYPIPV